MLLFCHANPRDKTMALASMAIVDEFDLYVFEAAAEDDAVVVRMTLREFFAKLTQLDGGTRPRICVEGFNFDEPISKRVLEAAHGLFENGLGPRVEWKDISRPTEQITQRSVSALDNARLIRDEVLGRALPRGAALR